MSTCTFVEQPGFLPISVDGEFNMMICGLQEKITLSFLAMSEVRSSAQVPCRAPDDKNLPPLSFSCTPKPKTLHNHLYKRHKHQSVLLPH